MASNNAENNIPQWKRDLIQRRRQQQKIFNNNGVKITKGFGSSGSLSNIDNSLLNKNLSDNTCNELTDITTASTTTTTTTTLRGKLLDERGDNVDLQLTTVELSGRECTNGVGLIGGAVINSTNRDLSVSGGNANADVDVVTSGSANVMTTLINSVASNMRLEADVFPIAEESLKFTGKNNINHIINTENSTAATTTATTTMASTLHEFGNDNLRCFNNIKKITMKNRDDKEMSSIALDNKNKTCVFTEFRKKNLNKITDGKSKIILGNGKSVDENCESDSSEELQYGPGIVNRLKSKYLNLTLREMNKTRVSVQRFRRAASLEDLLDCNDANDDDEDDDDGDGGGGGGCNDEPEKIQRKFMKKTMAAGVAAKTERYRNATRGNDSIKRARSVETLMRYQLPIDDVKAFNSTSITSGGLVKQQQIDTNDDHIVLIDRTTVKIESRLSDCEQLLSNQRPKILNKPKRLKPLLAETERPPTDLVKTTMKIFEGSVKKLKPKGDVAIKVATFKTINDTYKAQTLKKCIPKPPIQPKPFNGISNKLTSPKKIALINASKAVTDIIDNNDDNGKKIKNDGVITETIVQSVSSVVSKFQQIEKSQSPSPEPNLLHKYKYSPAPSPEPPLSSSSSSTSSAAATAAAAAALISNKQKAIVDVGNLKSPPSTPRILSPLNPSPKRDISRSNSTDINSINKLNNDNYCLNADGISEVEKSLEIRHDNMKNNLIVNEMIIQSEIKTIVDDNNVIADDDDDNEVKIDVEMVDSPRRISKLALDNISKAGCSIKFNFDGESCAKKNYLPGLKSNGDSTTHLLLDQTNSDNDSNISTTENDLTIDNTSNDVVQRINERLIGEKELEMPIENDNKEISSVGLIKLSSTHGNDVKTQMSTVKNPKLETVTMPQKQIGIIRPLVTTKTQQIAQQLNLSNREMEKNLINRVKSIEQPTKVVVSMKNSDEIQPTMKKNCGTISEGGVGGVGGSGGLWDTKPWNQQNNTMVFNFSNRKDVPDYIENDGLIIRRKKEKPKAGDGGGIIVLDATLDASTTDDSDWEMSGSPPSPCDVSFLNDNILINGRSNLSKSPRNHKLRIQFDDNATRTFEYPSEASILEDEGTSVDGETSSSGIEQQQQSQLSMIGSKSNSNNATNPILGGGSLASYTPSKVDLVSEGFELGITRALTSTPILLTTAEQPQQQNQEQMTQEFMSNDETDDNNTKSVQDNAAWGVEATADLLY